MKKKSDEGMKMLMFILDKQKEEVIEILQRTKQDLDAMIKIEFEKLKDELKK